MVLLIYLRLQVLKMKNQIQSDNFDKSLTDLFSLTARLYGGYYEPKSERDAELADDLWLIYIKHRYNKQENNGSIR